MQISTSCCFKTVESYDNPGVSEPSIHHCLSQANLKWGKAIHEKDSWFLSLIPRLSNTVILGHNFALEWDSTIIFLQNLLPDLEQIRCWEGWLVIQTAEASQ